MIPNLLHLLNEMGGKSVFCQRMHIQRHGRSCEFEREKSEKGAGASKTSDERNDGFQ